MKLQILSLFLAAISSASAQGTIPGNGSGPVGTTTYRLFFGQNQASFIGAALACDIKNGILADVTSDNIDFFKKLLGPRAEYAYINFLGKGYPALSQNGTFIVDDPTVPAAFICQYSAPRS